MIMRLDHSNCWNSVKQIDRSIFLIEILEHKNKALIDPAPKLRLSVQMALTRTERKRS